MQNEPSDTGPRRTAMSKPSVIRFLRPLTALCTLHFTLCTLHFLPAAEPDPVRADELALQAAGLPFDGPGLVAFLRQRAAGDPTPDQLAALVSRFGAGDRSQRETACRDLI